MKRRSTGFYRPQYRAICPSIHQAAECYLEGRGVERSYVNGIRLLRAAAEKGDYEAARRLQSLRLAEEYPGAGF